MFRLTARLRLAMPCNTERRCRHVQLRDPSWKCRWVFIKQDKQWLNCLHVTSGCALNHNVAMLTEGDAECKRSTHQPVTPISETRYSWHRSTLYSYSRDFKVTFLGAGGGGLMQVVTAKSLWKRNRLLNRQVLHDAVLLQDSSWLLYYISETTDVSKTSRPVQWHTRSPTW